MTTNTITHAIKASENERDCADCRAQYHEECWTENAGCAIFGCPSWAAGQGVPAQPQPATASIEPQPTVAAPIAAPLPQVGAPATSFCDQCGGRVEPDHQFCASCGNAVADQAS